MGIRQCWPLQDYTKPTISLPNKLSGCTPVLEFLEFLPNGVVQTSKDDNTPGSCTRIIPDGELPESFPRHQVLRVLQVHATSREATRVVLRRHVHR